MFKSPGILIVDPIPFSGKMNNLFEPFWMILMVSGDIGNYYRHQLEVRYNLKLVKPVWGSHVSVISGETIFKTNYDMIVSSTKDYLKKNNNASINDLYLHLLDKKLVTIEELANWETIKNKFHKKEIHFNYDISPRTNGKHWWLKVISEDFENIREECGYTRTPYWSFHLTLGTPLPIHSEHSLYIYNNYTKFNWTH